MKNKFNMCDAKRLHDAINNSVKQFADNGLENYILLSGGADSLCVLYAVIELGLPYKVINFKFEGKDSIDTDSVRFLWDKIKFPVEWLELPINNIDVLRQSVCLSKQIFGRIRKVKVETIYAMLLVREKIPKGVNILSGFGGDGAVCYHKNDAILISKVGQEAEEVLKIRRGNKNNDEFRHIFSDWNYFTPYHEKEVTDVLIDYTTTACNARFPKSAFVYAYADSFRKYENYRRPIGFHKASHEVDAFEELAKQNGFNSALSFFNAIGKELENVRIKG